MTTTPRPTADLIIDNAAQIVTCEPSLGEGAVGVVERGGLAARGERIVYLYGVNHVSRVVKRGRDVWLR